ncbi:MAG TPA: hypothetical protein VF981_02655 [Gemmatimonadaceae bacterium]
MTLTVPPGAVRDSVEVTLRPIAPEAGLWMSVALEPAGLVFGKSFELTARLPESVTLTDPQLMLGPASARIYVPTTVDLDARTLTTQLWFFGVDPSGAGISAMGRARSGTPGPAIAASGGGGNNNFSAGPVDCQQVIANVQQAFNSFLQTGAYRLAIDAALAIAGQLLSASCPGADQWIAQARQIACDRYAVAVQTVGSPISTFRQFSDETEPIVEWVAVSLGLAADCTQDGDYMQAMQDRIQAFLTFITGQLAGLTANDHGTYQDLKEEAKTAIELVAVAEALGQSVLADLIDDLAFRVAVDRMRANAYAQCRNDGWHYPLSRLTRIGFWADRDIIGVQAPRGPNFTPPSDAFNFTDDDIFEDLQYCGTDVEFRAVVSSGGQSAQEAAGTLGSAGNKVGAVSIEVPTRGTIRLAGNLLGFTCWNQIVADDELTIALDGKDVKTVQRSGDAYIGPTPIEIDIEQVAKTAGITPKEGITSELSVKRKRTECIEPLWGPEEYTLLKATLVWKNPTLDAKITLPQSVSPGARIPVDVRVDLIDLLGLPSHHENIDVSLNVSGGTAEQVTGVTDASGTFRTWIVVDPPPSPRMGSSTPSAGPAILPSATAIADLTVKAMAQSFEGVTAESETRTCTGHCACLQPRDPFDQPRIVDDSYISGGTPQAVASLDGPRIDYVSASGGGSTTGTTSTFPEWSPVVVISATATDYIWIEPLVAIQDAYQWLKVHGVGMAEVETVGGNCCGKFGDASAELTLSANLFGWFRAEAGSSFSGTLGPYDKEEVDEVRTFKAPTRQWWQVKTIIAGGLRHRGAGATSRATGSLQFQVLDLVDVDGNSIPAVICSAAGVNYGAAPSRIGGTGITISRPVLQVQGSQPPR